MNHFIFITLFFISIGLSAQHNDYIVRKGNDTTFCKIKRITKNEIYFISNDEQKLYNELSDVLGYKKGVEEFVIVQVSDKINSKMWQKVSSIDSVNANTFNIGLGIDYTVLPTIYRGLYRHKQRRYPYYGSSSEEVEYFKNAFGFVKREMPFIEFGYVFKNINTLGLGLGFYHSFDKRPYADFSSETTDLTDQFYFLAYHRPFSKQSIKTKGNRMKYPFWGFKVAVHIKNLKYKTSHSDPFFLLSGITSYKDNSSLALIQVVIGSKGYIKNWCFQYGLNLNLFSYASGSYNYLYDITYDVGSSYDSHNGNYSKSMILQQFLFHSLYFSVGYSFKSKK